MKKSELKQIIVQAIQEVLPYHLEYVYQAIQNDIFTMGQHIANSLSNTSEEDYLIDEQVTPKKRNVQDMYKSIKIGQQPKVLQTPQYAKIKNAIQQSAMGISKTVKRQEEVKPKKESKKSLLEQAFMETAQQIQQGKYNLDDFNTVKKG